VRKTRYILGVLIVLPLFLLFHPSSADSEGGRARALLIAINEYQSEDIPDLRGALNDLAKMRHVLMSRHGFRDENIHVLTDQAATRAGILAALEEFVAGTGPDDVVYIHYSGHGSQVEDLNGDEKDDGLDETITPHDGRMAGIPDITDDRLGEIISRLRCRYALIVLDSCHSGTATRGLGFMTRSIPTDTRKDLYESVGGRSIVPLITDRYLLMTGAASHQSALDGPVTQDRMYYGLFSFALATSLSREDLRASASQIHHGVKKVFKSLQTQFGGIAMPDPQLEGRADLVDRPLFPTSKEPGDPAQGTRAYVDVEPGESGDVYLVGEDYLDVEIGSHWAIGYTGPCHRLPIRCFSPS
jgi:hypothetical protein